ncbi:unnamed protein product [marine sediment metagenome]|uniref:Uncharacterized protein n=1 Tax=marine sediment metagenome TaxID=412755 RepID=X0YSM9_9ZZZZ
MPIHEIRESIEQNKITLDGNGFAIVQKVINLRENMSHKMLQCDAFWDNPQPKADQAFIMELLVTPTPVIYTDMKIANFTSRSPSASNDNILFKEFFSNSTSTNGLVFPNRFISARPTFTWYMPRLYLTLFVHGEANAEIDDVAISVYCAVKAKKVSLVTYGMGVIREDHIAQVAAVMSNGRSINPARNVGQAFPMWRYGGVRPELMISGANLVNFFNRTSSQEESQTATTVELRGFAMAARQMVPNLEAFGTAALAGTGGIPSWIRLELFKGVESGAIRDQWPPIKHADNGNVLTL